MNTVFAVFAVFAVENITIVDDCLYTYHWKSVQTLISYNSVFSVIMNE